MGCLLVLALALALHFTTAGVGVPYRLGDSLYRPGVSMLLLSNSAYFPCVIQTSQKRQNGPRRREKRILT